jgi:hypothetical protein
MAEFAATITLPPLSMKFVIAATSTLPPNSENKENKTYDEL